MKRSTRLIVALALTIILAAVSVSVWAGPGRAGSGPIPPKNYPGSCATSEDPNAMIDFDFGTVKVKGAACKLNVKLVKDPAKKVAPPLQDWSFLFVHAVDVKLVNGDITAIDDLEICVPFVSVWETQYEAFIWYRWDGSTWQALETTIVEGNPAMICGTTTVFGGDFGELGTFSLQGK